MWGISGAIPDWELDGWNDAAGRTRGDTLQMLAQAQTSLHKNAPPETGWSHNN